MERETCATGVSSVQTDKGYDIEKCKIGGGGGGQKLKCPAFSAARTKHSLQMGILGVEVSWEWCAAHNCFKSGREEGAFVSRAAETV